MILLLLDILKKFDYNINANNVKYVLRIFREEQAKENAKIDEFIKNMIEDIEAKRKQVQQERHDKINREIDDI